MSSAATPLNAIVIGAGIAGLTAALGLRRQGHNVRVYERSALAKEYGAAISIGPNANAVLRRLGIFLEDKEYGGVHYRGYMIFEDDEMKHIQDQTEYLTRYKNPYLFVLRQDLHRGLLKLATGPVGQGPPATLFTSSKVVDVDTTRAKIVLEDGTFVQGDLVVGGDGIHSRTRNRIPGAEGYKEKPFGKSAYRFLIPREKLLGDSLTEHYADKDGYFIVWTPAKKSEHLHMIMYPGASNTVMNVATTQEPEPGEEKTKDHLKEQMMETYGNHSKGIGALCSKAESSTIGHWQYYDLDAMPTFIDNRFALIGDAAHPFLPFLGQGGAMAIEDGASIASVLPMGTTPDQVPARLRLYMQARGERATFVQDKTRKQIHKPGMTDDHPLFGKGSEFSTWLYDHDAWAESEKLLAASNA